MMIKIERGKSYRGSDGVIYSDARVNQATSFRDYPYELRGPDGTYVKFTADGCKVRGFRKPGDIVQEWPPTSAQPPEEDGISKLRAELSQAEEARDRYKDKLLSAGVCMACVDGSPDPNGCSDCMGTGWDHGAPAGFISETYLDQLRVYMLGMLKQIER